MEGYGVMLAQLCMKRIVCISEHDTYSRALKKILPSSSSSWFVDLLAHWIPFRQVACHPIISGPRDAVQPMFCPVLSMPWQGPVAAIGGTRYVHWHVAAKVYQQLADCCIDHRSKIFCICKRFCNAWKRLHSRLEGRRTLGT